MTANSKQVIWFNRVQKDDKDNHREQVLRFIEYSTMYEPLIVSSDPGPERRQLERFAAIEDCPESGETNEVEGKWESPGLRKAEIAGEVWQCGYSGTKFYLHNFES